MRGIWKRWMDLWIAFVFAFAIVLMLVALPQMDSVTRPLMRLFGGPALESAVVGQMALRFAFGLQGALTLGWGITVLGCMRFAERIGASIWVWLLASFCAWYAFDSAISIGTGFPINAASNTIVLTGLLVPILGSGVLRQRAAA